MLEEARKARPWNYDCRDCRTHFRSYH